jgi:Tfp pilus assembly protein PilO
MKDWPWYGYVIVGAVIFLMFFFFYAKPKNAEIKRIKDERITLENEIVRLRQQKQQMDEIEKEISALNIKLVELESIIPREKETDVILSRIQQLAYDSRLDIQKFIPKGLVNQEFYWEWPISIEITGNYPNLAIFYDRLSNFSRLFSVEDFTIKAVRSQTDATTLTASSTAKTYIYQETPPVQENPRKKKGRKK